MNTTAVRDGDDWVINGSKNFITHAISGDVAVVIVRTGEKGDSHGMSAFVIEKGTPGFSGGKKEDKLGMRASETAALFFDNCRVSNDQMLGQEGEGFIQAMKILDGGRISIAALALGIAQGALDCSVQYSKEREQFGKPISQFQGISFKLADMATDIEASELLIMQAADLKNRGEKVTKESAYAKYYASEVSVRVSTEAVQIHGGYGYTKEYPAEKFYRDSKLCTIVTYSKYPSPAPLYCSGTNTPIIPSSPIFLNTSTGKCCASSHSIILGRISFSAKSRAICSIISWFSYWLKFMSQ
jgi:hypothetical protein